MENTTYKNISEVNQNSNVFITVKEMKAQYGLSQKLAYELIHIPGFPVIFSGKKAYVLKDRLIAWLEDNIGLIL